MFISSCHPISFCHTYFGALLLGLSTLRIVKSSWKNDLFHYVLINFMINFYPKSKESFCEVPHVFIFSAWIVPNSFPLMWVFVFLKKHVYGMFSDAWRFKLSWFDLLLSLCVSLGLLYMDLKPGAVGSGYFWKQAFVISGSHDLYSALLFTYLFSCTSGQKWDQHGSDTVEWFGHVTHLHRFLQDFLPYRVSDYVIWELFILLFLLICWFFIGKVGNFKEIAVDLILLLVAQKKWLIFIYIIVIYSSRKLNLLCLYMGM